jgi:CoA:oxalate CoA-transferase
VPEIGRRLSLLDGIRVLDLTRFLAGPFGSLMLADMGALVTKVEPLEGDSSRSIPPHKFDGESAYFLSVNRNKRSVSMDLHTEESREILRRLIADSDIVLDNLRATQRARLGLDFETLQRINPRVISCSLTGFGSDGPYRDRPAYDMVVQALSGVMSLTGPVGGPSVRTGVPIGDVVAGINLVVGALGALEYRHRIGVGTHIDISMLDTQVSLLSYLAEYYLIAGVVARHQGRAHLSLPTYNTFETGDGGEIVVVAGAGRLFAALCTVLGLPELPDDPKFSTPEARLENKDELLDLLRAAFRKRNRDEVYAALRDGGVPSAVVNSIDEALSDPQVLARDMVVKVPSQLGNEYLSLGSPIKSELAAGEQFYAAPGLGQHNDEVLASVGYSPAEIDKFRELGVISPRDPGDA